MNKTTRFQISKMVKQMDEIEPMWEKLDGVEQRRILFAMILTILGALIDE